MDLIFNTIDGSLVVDQLDVFKRICCSDSVNHIATLH